MFKAPPTSITPLIVLVYLLVTPAIQAAHPADHLQLIELDGFSNKETTSQKALKILHLRLKKASRHSAIDEAKLNNALRVALRESGMFKRILEPWQEQADAITVEIVGCLGSE